jgi:hypothetical protein
MPSRKPIARAATIRQAIEANRESRKTLVRLPAMFGSKFVVDHDSQLLALRKLLSSRW